MPESPEGRRGAPPSLSVSVTRPVPTAVPEGVVEDDETGDVAGGREERDTLPPGAVELAAAAP
jgi:hypothetical protein